MSLSGREFFVSTASWPTAAADKEAFLRDVPPAFWHRDPTIQLTVAWLCKLTETSTIDTGTGRRTYHIWRSRDGNHMVIFKHCNPPDLIMLADFGSEDDTVICKFTHLSGELVKWLAQRSFS